MNVWEAISVAMEGLRANKLRSTLTMLGIIIGVGAVIVMFAVGEGAKEQLLQRVQAQGSNVLTVRSGQARSGMVRMGAGSTQNLTLDDADALTKDCPSVQYVAPDVSQNQQIKFLNQNTNTSVMGVTPDYPAVRNYQIAEGRFFTAGEVKSLAKVVVMCPTAATNLFGDASPVGKTIRIRGIQFQVIGLTVAKGGGGFGGDPDDQVLVPITTAMNRMFGVQKVREIVLQVKSQDLMTQAQAEADAVMTKRHPPNANGDANYNIQNMQDFIDMLQQNNATMTWLLASVALVSLLVGGIGVMNIMLVSVTERTREIGIRMAVGARSRDILRQFLVESLSLSILGGAIGIALGYLVALIASKIGSTTMIVPFYSVVLSFCFSAVVGLGFGIYPAWKASQLNPIEALRYE